MRMLLTVALFLLAAPVWAVPLQIPYSGQLADDQGDALQGTHILTFSLYHDAQGNVTVWTETHSVTLSSGHFQVELGSSTTLDGNLLDDYPLFLGISVDGAADMTPRRPLLSVPYAILAEEAFQATQADHALTADALTGAGGGGGWSVIGTLQDIYSGNGVIAGYPLEDYEYGIRYAPAAKEPVPVLYATWNSGHRLINKDPTIVLSDNPSSGMEWGGFLFFFGTSDPADDNCTSTAWRHLYWKMNSGGGPMIQAIGGNGCVPVNIWARAR